MIGGFVAEHFDVRAPFFVAAALALANVAFGLFALPESRPWRAVANSNGRAPTPLARSGAWTHLPMVAGLLFAAFLYQIADHSLPAVWMFYTQHKFGWGPSETGWSLTFVALTTGVIVMGGLTGVLVPKLGERRAIVIGFLLMTVGFLGYAFAPVGWMIYPAIVFGSLGGIANPAMQSVMSRQVGPSSQGELQGAVASLASIAAIISPLFMTQLFNSCTDARCLRALSGRAVPRIRSARVVLRVYRPAHSANGDIPDLLAKGDAAGGDATELQSAEDAARRRARLLAFAIGRACCARVRSARGGAPAAISALMAFALNGTSLDRTTKEESAR